jgi:hypothetical protein
VTSLANSSQPSSLALMHSRIDFSTCACICDNSAGSVACDASTAMVSCAFVHMLVNIPHGHRPLQ